MAQRGRRSVFAADGESTLQTFALLSTTPSIPHSLPTQPANIQHAIDSMARHHVGSTSKGVLIGVLSAFGSALFVVIIMGLIYFLRYTNNGRILLDRIGRPGEFDDEQAFAREEAEALESMDDLQRAEYMRAKAFVEGNPPESATTDISLSQFLAIQEKGVSAWEFEAAVEIANCFVEARTEIEFFDTECSVQTNLPVPKQNEVYYWEAKIFEKPDTTTIGIGMTTKPYPLFRMPGFHKTSVAYLSPGHRRFNQPFTPTPAYGPPFVRGDVVGCGYRPRTGTVFFTRNGKKLDDITHTLKTQNLFPTVGATGPATIHVNFGQMGFVYIEANVKKWGLAPASGSLAPPPPYGSEQGSILLDQGQHGVPEGAGSYWPAAALGPARHGRTRSAQVRLARNQLQRSPGPQRSPTDISLAQFELASENGELDEGVTYAVNTGVQAQPQEVPGLGLSHMTSEQQRWASGMLDVNAPPPEYSSPVDRSIHIARAREERMDQQRHQAQQQQHPTRTSSRPQNQQSQARQEEATSYEQDRARRHRRRREQGRHHRARQGYFDVSSVSGSEASNASTVSPSESEGSERSLTRDGGGDSRRGGFAPYTDHPSEESNGNEETPTPSPRRQRRSSEQHRHRFERDRRTGRICNNTTNPNLQDLDSGRGEAYQDERDVPPQTVEDDEQIVEDESGEDESGEDESGEDESGEDESAEEERSPPVPYEVAVGEASASSAGRRE